ncbi:hypothetical protein [Streptomyces globisporus]|uniref:hypothetical protein n=1 Tax=Streptomyces globisporus TaxID=1908 RepID=UPI0037A1B5B1
MATALGVALALTGGSVQALPSEPGQELRGRPGVQDFGDPAEGTDAPARKRPTDPAKKAAVKQLDKAVWPKGGSAKLAVATTSPVEKTVGGLPVAVTAVTPGGSGAAKRTASPAGPAEVAVDVLPTEQAAAIGAGALLRVGRTDATEKRGKVRLSVNYSEFAEAYGGDYGARLQLVQLPACAAVATPGSKACPEQAKPLATVNSAEDRTVTADVLAAAAPASGAKAKAALASGSAAKAAPNAAPLVALAAGPSSAQGSYKATALAPSASWSVANSSGGFSWSYPLRTVPTPGGQSPSIGLGYSSQSADGRTSVTNNQGSWAGEGFSYDRASQAPSAPWARRSGPRSGSRASPPRCARTPPSTRTWTRGPSPTCSPTTVTTPRPCGCRRSTTRAGSEPRRSCRRSNSSVSSSPTGSTPSATTSRPSTASASRPS